MFVLHGTWLPNARFFAWGESPEPGAPGTEVPAEPSAAMHPRLTDDARLQEAGLYGAAGTAVAVLPAVDGEPLAPPHSGFGPDPAGGRIESSPWLLRGRELDPLDALLTLAGLTPADGLQLGDDWRYWARVAQLVLELLGRERFMPALSLTGDAPRAYWRIVMSERQDAERLGALALAMPPACRALSQPPPEARTLLLAAIDAMVDAAARHWAPDLEPAAGNGTSTAGQRWFGALLAPGDNAFEAEPIEVVQLAQHLSTWTKPLMPPPEAPFRTCLRLEAPPEGAPDSSPWRLEFALQASDDPSLLIPAQQVWRGSGAEVGFLARRFERPQERLLEDLGRAGKIFPPVQRGLLSATPEAVELTTQEAYAFMRTALPQLEEAGYGVLIPPWWRKGHTRVGVKITMREGDSFKPGKMGQQALVDYDWHLALGDETLTREDFEALVKLKQPLLKLRGKWVELDPAAIDDVIRFFETQRSGQLHVLDAIKLASNPSGQAGGLPIVAVQAEGEMGEFLGNFGPGDWLAGLTAPEDFRGTLRPYQERGYAWLASMRKWCLGACLADDMGLGKTIQVLALLLRAKADAETVHGPRSRANARTQPAPWLLICPTSLVGNWRREAEHFAPGLKVLIHHGAGRTKGESFANAVLGYDLVISTYTLLFRDEEHLAGVTWSGVVFDEAQNIKNATSKQAQAARRVPADWRVALTGTPVENHLADLWSILETLNPGYLGNQAAFRSQFAIPIERYKDEQAGATLRHLVKPFILRRLKTDPTIIQDLPEKNEQKVYCPLTKEQASLYQVVVSEMVGKIDSSAGITRKGLVLASLTKLKQVVDHPALFLDDKKGDLAGRSGKLTRLTEMLEEVVEVGDRALVFSQFAEMGHLLVSHLQKTFGRDIPFLHGGVPAAAREKMVRDFQDRADGPPVLVLSLKAGGVGLNLTRANHVFHFDRWWNPAVENQATDRAFRIGQTRNVMVHKFVCLGTLEEKIDQMLEDKKALSSLVVGEGEGWLTELSTDQLRDILALRDEAIAVD
ncbi:MAG: DEAD/DEAH box helicase [Candidatus Sericytochromatia bacterium]|nr:DEAD/DEAH box helicase [Candidatus Sericytochromatia bacterium]